MPFPRFRKGWIVGGLFSQDLGHSMTTRTAKFDLYPMTKARLQIMLNNGNTHVHLVIERTTRIEDDGYHRTDKIAEVMSIQEALDLLEQESE